jgi:hypothetical protein
MQNNEDFESALQGAAASMPQFDVPERLSQNIMAAVEAEHAEANRGLRASTLVAFAALAGVMLIWNSFDTSAGWISWCVSIPVLWLFKLLFESGDTQEPVAR